MMRLVLTKVKETVVIDAECAADRETERARLMTLTRGEAETLASHLTALCKRMSGDCQAPFDGPERRPVVPLT